MGTEETHVSQQRRDSGAYWVRGKSISGVFEFDAVTFYCCTSAAARLRNLYMFTPYLSQEHQVMLDLKLLESFLTYKTSTHARVAERTTVLLCERHGGGQQIERK